MSQDILRAHGFGGGKSEIKEGEVLLPNFFTFDTSLISVSNNENTTAYGGYHVDVDGDDNIYSIRDNTIHKQKNGVVLSTYSNGDTLQGLSLDEENGLIYIGGGNTTHAYLDVLDLNLTYIKTISVVSGNYNVYGIDTTSDDYIYLSCTNNRCYRVKIADNTMTSLSCVQGFVVRRFPHMNEIMVGTVNGDVEVINEDTFSPKFIFQCGSFPIMGIICLDNENVFVNSRASSNYTFFQYKRSYNGLSFQKNVMTGVALVGNDFLIRHITDGGTFYHTTKDGGSIAGDSDNLGFNNGVTDLQRLSAISKHGKLYIVNRYKQIILNFGLRAKKDYKF